MLGADHRGQGLSLLRRLPDRVGMSGKKSTEEENGGTHRGDGPYSPPGDSCFVRPLPFPTDVGLPS